LMLQEALALLVELTRCPPRHADTFMHRKALRMFNTAADVATIGSLTGHDWFYVCESSV